MSNHSADEYDSDDGLIEVITTHDYVTEARQIIYDHDDITVENALLLNQQMQTNLLALRARLEQMLLACQNKYSRNETILSKSTRITSETSKARRTYYYCGYPYFKNRQAFGAPPPQDYAMRYKTMKELFPLKLEGHTRWTSAAKVHLIQAVKKQVINFLQVKNRDQIRAIAAERGDDADSRIKALVDANAKMSAKQLSDLYTLATSKQFNIDWYSISAGDLKEQHTMNECIGMWYGYLMPSINRSQWNLTEEDELLNAVNRYSVQNWPAIAQLLNRRSPYQCFVHYHAVLSEKNIAKNVKWTKEEDAHLIEMVEKYRIGEIIPWTKILESMPGRYKAQIYNRYMFSLNPSIKRDRFSVEEDCIIMAAVEENGTNFQNFPVHLLPGRNFVQIRNRYNNVLRHNGKVQHWTLDDDQKLIDLVEKYDNNKDWARIADEIQVHSRLSCRSRYNTIVRYLQQHPNATIADVPRRKRKFSSQVTSKNWMETIIREKQKDQLPDEAALAVQKERYDKRLIAYINNDLGNEYYKFLKYSYNYRVGETHAVLTASQCERLRALTNLLGSSVSLDARLPESVNQFVSQEFLPQVKVEPGFGEYLRNCGRKDIRLPPSLPTVLGLRALAIMFECKEDMLLRRSTKESQSAMPAKTKKTNTSSKVSSNSIQELGTLHISEVTEDDSILSIPSAPTVRPIALVRQQTPTETLQLFKRRFKQLFHATALLANVSPTPMTVESDAMESLPGTSHVFPVSRKRKAQCTDEQAHNDVKTLRRLPIKRRASSDEQVTNYTIETDDGVFRITVND